MKTSLTWTILAVVVVALLGGTALQATEKFAKEQAAKCTVCHDKPGSELLTSKGIYFEYKGSFDGHDEVLKKYRKCTKCHAKAPGSTKLTKKGEELKSEGVTMDHVITEPSK